MSIVMNMDLEEIISHYARRGDTETLAILRMIQEDIEKSIDPDYNPETDSEEYSDSEEEGNNDLVEELIEVNPSLNGFCSLS
jgi:phosphoribosylamine-glycine ligase